MKIKKNTRLTTEGRSVVIETGRLAKQADGSVLISCNGTQVLVTACSSREMKDGQDFFPLTVDYVEKILCCRKVSWWIYQERSETKCWRNT